MTITTYQTRVRKALRADGKYSPALEIQIYTLATALCTLELATRAVLALDGVTVVTPQGEKAHPAFKIQRDAQEQVTKQMKALGLRTQDLSGMDDNDPMADLVNDISRQLSE